jgi:hypothetical protein
VKPRGTVFVARNISEQAKSELALYAWRYFSFVKHFSHLLFVIFLDNQAQLRHNAHRDATSKRRSPLKSDHQQ